METQLEIFKSTERAATRSVQELSIESNTKSDRLTLNDQHDHDKSQADDLGVELAQHQLKANSKKIDLAQKVFLYIFDQANDKMLKVSYSELAQEIGCGESSLRRAIYKLRDQELVKLESAAGKAGVMIRLTDQALLLKNITSDQIDQCEVLPGQQNIVATKKNDLVDQKIELSGHKKTDLEIAATEYEKQVKEIALKNMGIKVYSEKNVIGETKGSLAFVKYGEMLLLVCFIVLVNFIMAKSSSAYFSKVDNIPGVSGGVIYILIEAFIAYISFTLGQSKGWPSFLKILAIVGLVGLSLAMTVKGSIDSIQQHNAKNQVVFDRSNEIKLQVATLDQRIQDYLSKEWRTAAYKLEQSKLNLLNELSLIENKKMADSEISNVKTPETLNQQIVLVVILRIVLGFIGIFCCKKFGILFFEAIKTFDFIRTEKRGDAYARA